jgi:hypothetical protein
MMCLNHCQLFEGYLVMSASMMTGTTAVIDAHWVNAASLELSSNGVPQGPSSSQWLPADSLSTLEADGSSIHSL